MAAFIFSGALAFVLYQALAFAHMPSPTRDWFRISDITISFDDSSARWARLMLRAGIVFVVLACVLLIHEVAGPADVISRNRVSILVGFFFGPLFAMWINAIFAHPPGKDLTRGQVIAGIGLVLMFILGSLGNETGRLIQQYANKLQSLKLAGAELSFSEKKTDRDNKLAGALQLAGAAHITGSAALDYLSQLDVIITRDAGYLRLFGAPPGDLDRAATFVSRTLKKPLTCLASWYQWTADTPSIRQHVRAFARIFRDLGVLDDENRIRKQIIQESLSIASDVAALEVPQEVDLGCKDLFLAFCPPPYAVFDSSGTVLDRSDARACLAGSRKQLEGPNPFAGHSPLTIPAGEFVQQARTFLGGFGGVEARPYLAIAQAGLMVELGSYEGAASRLHSWIRDRKPSAVPVVQDWLDVRARSMMAAYVDEWIGEKGAEIPNTLRTLHLQNLDILRKGLARYVALSPVFAKNLEEARTRSEPQFRTPVACTTAGGDFATWQRLFASYLSMDVSYVQNALRHPDYAEKYAQSVSRDVIRLASLDLSCHPASDPTDPLITYAEVLQAYASNAVSYSAARRSYEPDDVTSKRLTDAERVVQLGLEIVQSAKAPPGSLLRERQSFLDMITPDRRDNAEAELKRTLNDIKGARRDLGQ